jgi:hypothetical protein
VTGNPVIANLAIERLVDPPQYVLSHEELFLRQGCLSDWDKRARRRIPSRTLWRAWFGIIQLNELAKRKGRMIVLKTAQDRVQGALQAVSGIVERRHTLPILANILLRGRQVSSLYDDYVEMRRARLTPTLPPQAMTFTQPEPVRPAAKLASNLNLGLARRRVRKLRGFFSATKVNARNAP